MIARTETRQERFSEHARRLHLSSPPAPSPRSSSNDTLEPLIIIIDGLKKTGDPIPSHQKPINTSVFVGHLSLMGAACLSILYHHVHRHRSSNHSGTMPCQRLEFKGSTCALSSGHSSSTVVDVSATRQLYRRLGILAMPGSQSDAHCCSLRPGVSSVSEEGRKVSV